MSLERGGVFTTLRPPKNYPCRKIGRKVLETMLHSGWNEERTAWAERLTFLVNHKLTPSRVDEVKLVLCMRRL